MTRDGAPTRGIASLAGAGLAILAGLPAAVGAIGSHPPRDWPLPFGLSSAEGALLRTVIYASGFLLALGLLRAVTWLASLARALHDTMSDAEGEARDHSGGQTGPGPAPGDAPAPLAEALYGFLPGPVQSRLARERGYSALLYTKVSILLCGGVGILLAGSYEPISSFDTIPPDALLRLGAGLYLAAESVDRYFRFARGRPSGSLIGLALYPLLAYRLAGKKDAPRG
jgi:hypothetical protein